MVPHLFGLCDQSATFKGKMTILMVVDRFSKMVHFIPLAKLPSAKETMEVMLHQVSKIYGFPKGIVTDRGPQFLFHVFGASFACFSVPHSA